MDDAYNGQEYSDARKAYTQSDSPGCSTGPGVESGSIYTISQLLSVFRYDGCAGRRRPRGVLESRQLCVVDERACVRASPLALSCAGRLRCRHWGRGLLADAGVGDAAGWGRVFVSGARSAFARTATPHRRQRSVYFLTTRVPWLGLVKNGKLRSGRNAIHPLFPPFPFPSVFLSHPLLRLPSSPFPSFLAPFET